MPWQMTPVNNWDRRFEQLARMLALLAAVLAAVPAALLVSCRPAGDPGFGDTVAAALESGFSEPAAPLSDSNILALLDHASMTDSAAARIAVGKASTAEIRAFAALMLREHHRLRVEAERVARRLRITPELPADDESEAEMRAVLALLNATDRGRDFDKAYMDHEAAFHLDVLETATRSMELAREAEVRAYIQKLAPMLRDHLDRAQALQARFR